MTGLRHFQAGSCSSRVRQCACVGGDDGNGGGGGAQDTGGGGGGAQDTEVVFKVFVFFCGHLIAERTLKGRTTPLCAQRHGGTQLVAEEEGREKGEKEEGKRGGGKGGRGRGGEEERGREDGEGEEGRMGGGMRRRRRREREKEEGEEGEEGRTSKEQLFYRNIQQISHTLMHTCTHAHT